MRTLLCTIATATMLATPATSATIFGEFWDAAGPLGSIAQAEVVIAGGAPDATFMSSGIDYPIGPQTTVVDASTTLEEYLGADAASIVGTTPTDLTYSVFRFSGFLELTAGMNTVSVGSDDGFVLDLNGSALSFDGNRSFATTSVMFDNPTTELIPFELIYWENTGLTGIEFSLNGEIVTGEGRTPTVVPLPATAGLLLIGGLGFGLLRRRA